MTRLGSLVMATSDLAWAAGFFDGEGCVSVCRNTRGGTIRQLSLGNTHEAAVRRFANIVGEGGIYTREPRKATHKRSWVWVASSRKADGVAALLLPYLFVKARQAALCMEAGSLVVVGHQGEGQRQVMDDLIREVQALNGNQKGQRPRVAAAVGTS